MNDKGQCILCGLPVATADDEYCCVGCERVHEILTASSYTGNPKESIAYLEAVKSGLVSEKAKERPAVVDADLADKREYACDIEGMWCTSCAWLVEETLGGKKGVIASKISFLSDKAKIEYDPKVTSPTEIAKEIDRLGYKVSKASPNRNRRVPLLRFGVAAFFTTNAMVFSYAYYADEFTQAPQLLRSLLPWLLALLSAPVVFGAGFPILRRAYKVTRAKTVTMDSLIALGSLSAWFYSLGATVVGNSHIYFDSSCALITFWLLGRLIEGNAFARAEQVGLAISRLLPKKVRVVNEKEVRWVKTEEVQKGDVIRVAPGERCPVDCLLRSSHAQISTAVINGEPRPRRLNKGDFVPGGSVCGDGGAELEVFRAADKSILAHVAERVTMATGKPTERVDVSDALAKLFFPIVLVLTVVSFAGSLGAGLTLSMAFERALSVLVVSCPCALGLAAPLARVIGAGALASMGVIARDEGTVDDLAAATRVAFDKTGTLTNGDFSLVDVVTGDLDKADVLKIAKGLERGNTHPVAKALMEIDAEFEPGVDVESVTGCGVQGTVDGTVYYLGKPSWGRGMGQPPEQTIDGFVETHQEKGNTVVVLGTAKRALAAFSFGDSLKEQSGPLVAQLQQMGLALHVLSGDAEAAVSKVCLELGISSWNGAVNPDEKADWLLKQKTRDGRRPVFVGDGINDAPALASSLGIAVAASTDFAKETASVLLLDREFDVLPNVFSFARKMKGIVIQNLGWAAMYNLVAIPAAMMGYLNPILAAAAMVGSGLIVTINTLRLLRYR